MKIEFDLKEYKQSVLTEVQKEARENDPLLQRCYLVSFVSHSGGRGRKRQERQVELLVIDNSYAHIVVDGEVQPRKGNEHIAIDVFANEVLVNLPEDQRTVDNLLNLLKGKH